jgi:hypothetical protein
VNVKLLSQVNPEPILSRAPLSSWAIGLTQAEKFLPWTDDLAYLSGASVTQQKRFIAFIC